MLPEVARAGPADNDDAGPYTGSRRRVSNQFAHSRFGIGPLCRPVSSKSNSLGDNDASILCA